MVNKYIWLFKYKIESVTSGNWCYQPRVVLSFTLLWMWKKPIHGGGGGIFLAVWIIVWEASVFKQDCAFLIQWIFCNYHLDRMFLLYFGEFVSIHGKWVGAVSRGKLKQLPHLPSCHNKPTLDWQVSISTSVQFGLVFHNGPPRLSCFCCLIFRHIDTVCTTGKLQFDSIIVHLREYYCFHSSTGFDWSVFFCFLFFSIPRNFL